MAGTRTPHPAQRSLGVYPWRSAVSLYVRSSAKCVKMRPSCAWMAHGHRVAVRDGAYFVGGERVTPEALARLAAELEPAADRADARAADAPGKRS